MKKLVLPILMLTIKVFSIYAQDCKYSKNSIDEFTKKTIKVTQAQTVFNSISDGQLNFALMKVDSLKFLTIHFKIKTTSSMGICFNNSSKMMLKFGNDSIIEIEYIEDIECAKYVSSYTYEITGNFLLTEYILEEYLSKFLLNKARIYFSEGYLDFEFNEEIKWPAFSFNPQGDKAVNPQFYFIRFLKCIK